MKNMLRLLSGKRWQQLGTSAAPALKLLGSNAGYFPIAMRAVSELKRDSAHPSDPASYPRMSPAEERADILERARYLCKTIIVEPEELIRAMPEAIGRHYQGQWAIYAAMMTAWSLCNIIRIYPDTRDEFITRIPQLIDIVMSKELREYDATQWREDPLESLSGNKSHMTYLSILAWMITNYQMVSDDRQYADLRDRLCQTLARRMELSRDLNLPSFPNKIVFLPDMMFTIMSLKFYSEENAGIYDDLLSRWIHNAKTRWLDRRTGLMISQYYPDGRTSALHGSYSGLNTTCLTVIDPEFGREQYDLLKRYFGRFGQYCAIREFTDKDPQLSFNIDAGPIVMGVSPTGTAFSMGAATFLGDWIFRAGLLRSAELAGHTIRKKGLRHYKLADIMLTGEAITLAMRTLIPYK